MKKELVLLFAVCGLVAIGCDGQDEDADTGSDGENAKDVCTEVCNEHLEMCPDDAEVATSCEADCDEIISASEMSGCTSEATALFDCASAQGDPGCGETVSSCEAEETSLEECFNAYEPGMTEEEPSGPMSKCVQLCEARVKMCPDEATEGETCAGECGAVESIAKTTGCEAAADALFQCGLDAGPIACGETIDCATESDALGACIDAYEP